LTSPTAIDKLLQQGAVAPSAISKERTRLIQQLLSECEYEGEDEGEYEGYSFMAIA
jgi:hypothetical protein